ncbi:phosphotransferase [Actinokineospora sp. HUAS TT18]|uniref:phosphotransferase n=1 Tax=Actinokineospora sp. HUAS TT18 TaxID=3447451 RepID=UPI003F526C0D
MLVTWMDEQLAAAGISRTGEVGEPRVRPWSTVLSAPTTAGPVWLKQTGAANGFEAALYEILLDVAPHRVLAPIAVDTDRGWLLLPDGGDPVGWDLPPDDLVTVLTDVLPHYATLQRDLAPHVDRMIAAGVTDMRPEIMPTRFAEAVAVVGGLPEVEAREPEFREWCARLAASPARASLDHNDLHPANILVNAGIRFYDWGDAVIAHPFAAMFVPLKVLLDKLGPQAPGTLRVRDAYLEAFTDLAPRAELVAELDLACRVAKVARTLVWARAIKTDPGEWADAPRETLLTLLADSYY